VISHPNEGQEQLREVLWTTVLKAHDGRTHSKLPARTASHEQEAQSQNWFERLGPNENHNEEKRRGHTRSNQVEHPIEERSGASFHSPPWLFLRLNNSW
jgi:hypothetical protein